MRYFTWTEPAGPAPPGTGAPRPGPRPARARDRELDEICCLEMT
jgi:hypothetical protein